MTDDAIHDAATDIERLREVARDAAEAATALQADVLRLRAALLMAVRQNEHDMLMTGDELRACREALEPNAPATVQAPQAAR